MTTALVLVHGRSQQMPRELRGDADRVRDYVTAKKRAWLAGLAKGLVLARHAPVAEDRVFFPFYGNLFADRIEAYDRRGGRRPDLEVEDATAGRVLRLREDLILQGATELGYQPDRELAYEDPELAERVRERSAGRDPGEEVDWGRALRVPVVRSALQFIARKTGATEWVIEEFLADVAYYLQIDEIRDAVLGVVAESVTDARQRHDDVVVVAHSLGTIVAYDLLVGGLAGSARLLVTAGSPLGFPIVQKNLRGVDGGRPPVPPVEPAVEGLHWLNAFDVRDVVALVHPLGDRFEGGAGKIRDERTNNPSGAHAIDDYLADPDVAAPIGVAAGG